jgi:hypothetical protein
MSEVQIFSSTESWQDLERWLVLDKPAHLNGLLPLVLEGAKRLQLRRLLPFTSMNRLCFSRTTGYPYSYDCPLAWPVEGGLFRVVSADEQTVLGEGDAARAADILAASLPQDCGPAIHGTKETSEGHLWFDYWRYIPVSLTTRPSRSPLATRRSQLALTP